MNKLLRARGGYLERERQPGRVHLKTQREKRACGLCPIREFVKSVEKPNWSLVRRHITGMAGLAFNDGFAGRFAGWQQEMQTWEREFSTWTGQAAFKSPPSVPTVKRFGRTKDQALLALSTEAGGVRRGSSGAEGGARSLGEEHGGEKQRTREGV
jgi:hypothetical protein